MEKERPLNIALVGDFFYPNMGGVEAHILNLAYCLIERGHKVVGITHNYGERTGVRYIRNGFKVYYCPFTQLPGGAGNIIWPMIHLPYIIPLLREIFVREEIDLVHTHQYSSMLGYMTALYSDHMGLRVVRTNHSMAAIEDPFVLQLNKLNCMLHYSNKLDHVICVSHAVRDNEIILSAVAPDRTSVIPNAIDSNQFTADPSLRFPVGTINIVYVGRITYRKGVDLLIEAIPRISKKYLNVHWIIGGDGDKFDNLKFLVKRLGLESRVELLGRIAPGEVCTVLNRGHIFVNTSITEAFCIAALEAVSAGLLVVTTNVGGTPEILPTDMLLLSDPNTDSLCKNLEKAIAVVRDISPYLLHERVKQFYSWRGVAERVEKIYRRVLSEPKQPRKLEFEQFIYKKGGLVFMVTFVINAAVLILLFFLDIFRPVSAIEKVPTFPFKKYQENKDKWGDHSFDLRKNKLNR